MDSQRDNRLVEERLSVVSCSCRFAGHRLRAVFTRAVRWLILASTSLSSASYAQLQYDAVFAWQNPYFRITIIAVAVVVLALGFLCYRLRVEKQHRQTVENSLNDSQVRLDMALWGASLGCWEWDLSEGLIEVDAKGAELLEGGRERRRVKVAGEGKIAELFRSLQDEMDTDEIRAERHVKLPGSSRWVVIRGRRVPMATGRPHAFGVLMDVSNDHAYQERLVKLSITDPLTGLLNRRYFLDRLTQSCSQSLRDGAVITIALLDIDNFKQVNDDYGHLVGDQALVQFSSLLKQDCRPYDLVSRFAGEQFMVLFYGMDKAQSCQVLLRFQELLRVTQMVAQSERFYCTFSCGIADSQELPPGPSPVNTLIRLVDDRLSRAKQQGCSQIILSSVA